MNHNQLKPDNIVADESAGDDLVVLVDKFNELADVDELTDSEILAIGDALTERIAHVVTFPCQKIDGPYIDAALEFSYPKMHALATRYRALRTIDVVA